jgi:hypothetical protein
MYSLEVKLKIRGGAESGKELGASDWLDEPE